MMPQWMGTIAQNILLSTCLSDAPASDSSAPFKGSVDWQGRGEPAVQQLDSGLSLARSADCIHRATRT